MFEASAAAEITSCIYSGTGRASRGGEEGQGGHPRLPLGWREGAVGAVPPGSVPSRPLGEGEAFLKATAPRDGATTGLGGGESSARAVPLRAGSSVQVPPKNSECPSSG